MKDMIWKRIVLVGVLLVVGIAGGAVLAVANGGATISKIISIISPVIHETGELKVVGNLDNDSVSILAPDGQVWTARIKYLGKETGKVEKSGENLTISVGDKIHVVKLIRNLRFTEEQKQKAVEMALNDEKVKELINGKNYTILKVGPWIMLGAEGSKTRLGTEQEAKIAGAGIWLKVEDKCYYIGVNFESGKVDIQEMPCLQ